MSSTTTETSNPGAPPEGPAPAVSVVMAVYNGASYLDEAVESILNQSLADFEFIIIDDGSVDDSLKILRRYAERDKRVRLVSRPNAGLARSLNEGLAMARGEFVARMDCDDVAYPARFATQVQFLRDHPDHAAVGSAHDLIDAKGRFLTTLRPPSDDAEVQKLLLAGHGAICHPSAMIRRQPLNDIGGYDAHFTSAQDLDMWLRLGERGKLANTPQPLLKFRLHDQSVSERKGREQRKLAREACERAWKRRGLGDMTFEAEHLWRPERDRQSRHTFSLKWGWWAFNSAQRRTALIYAAKAVWADPLKAGGWKLLACAALKRMSAAPV